MEFTTSWTLRIFSASSSEVSMPYPSSRALTSSTMSRESAPRSSMNEASGVTSSSLTPSCSQMISFTFCSTAVPISSSFARNSHVQATVHMQHVPGDVGGVRRRQKFHCRRDVLGPPHAARRDDTRVETLLRLVDAGRHLGLDEARRDGVDGDAA